MALRTKDPERTDENARATDTRGPEGDVAPEDEPTLDDRARRDPPAVRDGTGRAWLRRRRDGDHRAATTAAAASRARQRDEFGGVSWLSALVGWLAAAGLAAILMGIIGAAGAVLAVTEVGRDVTDADAGTIGLAGGIALLVVLAIAYWFGGYAAGRMARFDGARQGLAVWLCGVVAALLVAVLAAVGGSQYDVLERLNLPRVPIDSGTLTTGGLVALLASIVVTLGAAMLGAKVGERFHRRVDRAGLAD